MTDATREKLLEDHVADFDQASDPKTSVSKLKELMKSKQHTVVAAVASHPSATAGMLNVMSMHDHPAVRKCVACHPNTHLTTLWNLHGDSSKHVRTAVSENPNIPKGLKGGLSDTADRSEEMPVHSDDPRYDFLGESEDSKYYWQKEGNLHVMRQKRFKDRLDRYKEEHPHDVMALAHDEETKNRMHRMITGKGLNESELLTEDFTQMPRQKLVRKYKEYATKAIEHHKALNDPHPVFPKTVEGWHKLRLDHFLHGAKAIKSELEDRRANGIRE